MYLDQHRASRPPNMAGNSLLVMNTILYDYQCSAFRCLNGDVGSLSLGYMYLDQRRVSRPPNMAGKLTVGHEYNII